MNRALTRVPEKFQQALQLHQAGKLEQAQTSYEEILALEPGHSDAIKLLGTIAIQTRNLPRAVQLFGRALEIDPSNVVACCNRGWALRELGQFDAALASYDRAIAIKADIAEAHVDRGNVLRELDQLDAALASYNQAIALAPDYEEAFVSRGIVLQELKRWDAARVSYEQAIALEADDVQVYFHHGDVLAELKRFDAALVSYEKGIALQPDHAQAFSNRGALLHELNHLDASLASFDQAIALKLDDAGCHCNRGLVLMALREFHAALASFDRAIALKADHTQAYFNRGNALYELKQWDAALASYEQAIALKADYPEAYANRGLVLYELKQLRAALASYDRAIALNPDQVVAYSNRSVVLHELELWDAALNSSNQAIALKPDYAEGYFNRGNVLRDLKQWDAALASYDRAVALKGNHAGCYFNRSLVHLIRADFDKGWIDYEWRSKKFASERSFVQPPWLGKESVAGKTVLLLGEQGLGDTLQFCRYAKLVADLGARVILEVPKPLASLLTDLDGVSQVVVTGEVLPAFDCHCSLMSLPLAFGTTLSTIPAQFSYLRSSAKKANYWSDKLGRRTKPRVGLVWSGGFRPNNPELWSVNRRRNISLMKLAVLNHPDIEFFSLQKGQPAESELADVVSKNWAGPPLTDFTNLLIDFSDTAALIEQLDLIISVDTSTAHLAGALGKPVWILNRFDSCWRWLLDRDDSPWYPTVKLYRQERAGDWDSVVHRVAGDLMQQVR